MPPVKITTPSLLLQNYPIVLRSFASLVVLLTLVSFLSGCTPQKTDEKAAEFCYPYDLIVQVGENQMQVTWKVNCNSLMSGYYVYISEESLVKKYPGPELPASVKPFNRVPFPGDTDPSDNIQHFTAEGLDNGVKYYVSVRVINPDRTLSKPSNEVIAVCGPRGEMELSVRFKSERDGFSFEKNSYVRADAIDNDLYFYSKDEVDFLASPNRLGGLLRATTLSVLPYRGDLEEIKRNLVDIKEIPGSVRVSVSTGDWVHLVTQDNKHALVKVLDVTGSNEDRRIKLFYAFCPLANELFF
ncbi:MAG: hypothetical protein ACE5NG_17845 [bacterium]